MCPIFKNIDIHGTKDIIGEHMFDYCTQNCDKKLLGLKRFFWAMDVY